MLYSQWIVEKVVDNFVSKGNYDISDSRFVYESFDGNDWEIMYYRNDDVICGKRFNLIMHCGNGNRHQLGGTTKVGGKKRIKCVKYDYEGLIHFDLRAFRGEIRKAQMKIVFEPYSSSTSQCKSKTQCYTCKQCKTHCQSTRQRKSTRQYGLFYKCNSRSYNYFSRYTYNRCVNIYKHYLNSRLRYHSPYTYKYTYSFFNHNKSKRYSKSQNKKQCYLNFGSCFNPYSFYRSVLYNKSKSYCNPEPTCSHTCDFKAPDIVIYNQNKGPWDMKTVTYNSFPHCPWNDKIGEISMSDMGVKQKIFENDELLDLVQTWVDYPESNQGIVLTADFGKDYKMYYKVKQVWLKLYFKDKIMQITDNDLDDVDPRIDGRRVTWSGDDGNDPEIFYWNGYKIIQITDNDYDDLVPRISQQDLTWEGGNDSMGYDIYYGHSNKITNISHNGFDHYQPKIKNGKVTWHGGAEGGNDDEVFYFDGTKTIQITEGEYDDWFPPEIFNTMITWQGADGTDTEILYWDENDPDQVIRALTDNTINDAVPQISDSGIVWQADSVDKEIMFWNGKDIIQITDNDSLDDDRPDIDKGSIVWRQRGFELNSTGEIYYYNGGVTERITNNTKEDDAPLISNDNIIWKSLEYDSLNNAWGWELYYARKKCTKQKCTKK